MDAARRIKSATANMTVAELQFQRRLAPFSCGGIASATGIPFDLPLAFVHVRIHNSLLTQVAGPSPLQQEQEGRAKPSRSPSLIWNVKARMSSFR